METLPVLIDYLVLLQDSRQILTLIGSIDITRAVCPPLQGLHAEPLLVSISP